MKQQFTPESAASCLEIIRTSFDRQTFYFPKHLWRGFAIDLLSWGEDDGEKWHLPRNLQIFMQDFHNDMELARYTTKKVEVDLAKLAAQASFG